MRVDETGRLGTYRILRLLGRGGMGDVYLAWTGLRLVAIKILHANFASDPTFVSMFLAEARVAGRINHSSIAQVLDVGVDAGRLYMVMEYVAGPTLDDLINDLSIRSSARPLTQGSFDDGISEEFAEDTVAAPSLFPLRIAATVFAQVAFALAAAHRAGVVHRDISPHNILVSDTGAVKLIDFGIARTQDNDAKTSPGTFRGRFGYMAPEYVQGKPCDHRLDLFALGVVMWETFTRRRLYPGAAAAQLYAVIERPAERLDAVLPEFPVVLADVVERLLEREPDDRYDHAVEVAQTLERLLPALPDGGFRNLAHWTQRHLASRIEERARADHDDLQVIVAEEAAQQAEHEPEIELRSHTGNHLGGRSGIHSGSHSGIHPGSRSDSRSGSRSGIQSGSQSGSQVDAVWSASTPGLTHPPPSRFSSRLSFGLGMGAAALVAAAVALWVLVSRGPAPAPLLAAQQQAAPQDPSAPANSPSAPEPVPTPVASADAALAAEPELELEEAVPVDSVDTSAAPPVNGDDGATAASKRREQRRRDRENKPEPVRRSVEPATRTIEPARPPEPVAAPPPERVPAVATRIPQLAPPPPPPPAAPPRTPRVPASLAGDAARGGLVLGQCNACHSEQKKKRVEGKQMTRSQWERFFRNGTHDRYRPLGDRLTLTDLAAAKAYLSARALDGTKDQSAGVR